MRFPRRAAMIAVLALATPALAQTPSGFVVDISLSPRAAAELQRRDEGIVVATYYSGDPTRAHEDDADETGIDLGQQELTVPGRAEPVAVPDSVLRRERLSWITGAPNVLVNIYTARRSGPDNLLDCDFVSGTLAEVAGRTHPVRCRLIGE